MTFVLSEVALSRKSDAPKNCGIASKFIRAHCYNIFYRRSRSKKLLLNILSTVLYGMAGLGTQLYSENYL